MAKKRNIDPEYERYKCNYPKFPGIQKCLEILRRSNTRGAYLDAALSDLETHIGEYFQDVILAFRAEESVRVRILLMGIIAEAKLSGSVSFFIEHLRADDEEVRYWAIVGLENLGTKAARRALWEARSYTLRTPEETLKFRNELDRVFARVEDTKKASAA